MKPFHIRDGGEIVPTGNGIEVFAIKIGHLHRVTSARQRSHRSVLERRGKRGRFRMSIDDENVHSGPSISLSSSAGVQCAEAAAMINSSRLGTGR
jgi:hypothetical protein